MISVLIECRDDEAALAQTLAALVPGAVEGLISEVIVIDRESQDGTALVADSAGCVIVSPKEAATAMRDARGKWLLVLQPGARPLAGWIDVLAGHVSSDNRSARFRLAESVPFWRRVSDRLSRNSLRGGLLVRRDGLMRTIGAIDLQKVSLLQTAASAAGRTVRLDCRLMPAPRRRVSDARPAAA